MKAIAGPQVVYESNIDYEASYQKLAENPLVVADITQKGLISFRFKSTGTIFQVSPKGKIQVKWSSVEEKKTLLRLAKNVLVAKEGQKLKITPSKQQAWIHYPVPESFKLFWCNEETEYSRKGQVKIYDPEMSFWLGFYRHLERQHKSEVSGIVADLLDEIEAKRAEIKALGKKEANDYVLSRFIEKVYETKDPELINMMIKLIQQNKPLRKRLGVSA